MHAALAAISTDKHLAFLCPGNSWLVHDFCPLSALTSIVQRTGFAAFSACSRHFCTVSRLASVNGEAATISAEVRRRDSERFELDVAGGLSAGAHMLLGNAPKPTPFTTPTRRSQALSEETAQVAAQTGST